MTLYRNYATRTQAVTALNKLPLGESIMIVPYNPGAYQQESGSLKAVACKQRIKIELKKVLLVVEDEMPQSFLRVKKVAGEPTPLTTKELRTDLRDEAAALLQQAEALLAELAGSYTEEQDGIFSACHPHNGFENVMRQIASLHKPLARAKV
ncbi:hypothetical protein NT934_004008 [Salmonella enterica]|uniref:hypothetical protein n=1 Tax=Citrobacter freundii TaxID=546 RepID=UPI001BA8D259|nr:hypothetical protein [Citrobacter freundii]EJO8578642.1 hypothetical protein [Salmonella enterica]ELN2943233.1 hypothetical protein [Salmonella enterica]MBQ5149461.1 hypothetical protein [Citrobacter freundii]HEJ0145224.1 hypothetical protein [Citrobacter freundii]